MPNENNISFRLTSKLNNYCQNSATPATSFSEIQSNCLSMSVEILVRRVQQDYLLWSCEIKLYLKSVELLLSLQQGCNRFDVQHEKNSKAILIFKVLPILPFWNQCHGNLCMLYSHDSSQFLGNTDCNFLQGCCYFHSTNWTINVFLLAQ
jgi:hypothetical protein